MYTYQNIRRNRYKCNIIVIKYIFIKINKICNEYCIILYNLEFSVTDSWNCAELVVNIIFVK